MNMLHFFTRLLSIAIFFSGQVHSENEAGWGRWKWKCSASCGGGKGFAERECVDPGPNKCVGKNSKFGSCNVRPCPVAPKPISNKGWTPWMPWDCPVTCGGGTGSRYRICEDPDVCEGPKEETGRCGEEPCPVDPDAVNEGLRKQIEQQMGTSRHSFVVQKGEDVNIPCKDRIAGVVDREYPDAKVTWIKNGDLADVDGERIKMDDGGDLKVKSAKAEDNGLWWCAIELTKKESATLTFAAFAVQNDSPDIEVEKGASFEMTCKARSLSRLVKSKMVQKWIHNSTTAREMKGVSPEDTEVFKIPVSNFSHNGIWNCRYSDKSNREWTTSVFKVLVLPPRSLLRKLLPVVIGVVVSLALIAVIGWFSWEQVKKKRVQFEEGEEEFEEEDYGYDYEDEY